MSIQDRLEPSIPICAVLAALGGILEVFATAVLAYPAARMVQGYKWTDRQLKACLAVNIVFQILASLAGNLFATWFGPVSIVAPIFFASQLLANLVVFWIVLGLEAFSREMQIGTYVIVIAVVLLLVNGPDNQDYGDTTFDELITAPLASIWSIVLLLGMITTGTIIVALTAFGSSSLETFKDRSVWFKFLVLLIARASAFALNLSTGKAVVLETGLTWLIVAIVIKIVSGAIYSMAIVVQSTTVEQKRFVPINAATTILINAITGMLIWEDWRVLISWTGYICVFLLLGLGCTLLMGDLQLLQESAPETFLGAQIGNVRRKNRQSLVDNLRKFAQEHQHLYECSDSDDDDKGEGPASHASTDRPKLGRHNAWATIYESSRAVSKNSISARNLHYRKSCIEPPTERTVPDMPNWQSSPRLVQAPYILESPTRLSAVLETTSTLQVTEPISTPGPLDSTVMDDSSQESA